MKTVAIIATKGGSTKTCTAVSLACEAERSGCATVVLDLDPQCSAAKWSDWRGREQPAVVSIQPQRLSKTLAISRDAGARLALIDTSPHASQAAITAAEQADLVLIPCRPEIVDLSAIGDTAKIVKLVGSRSYVVISAAPHRAPKIEQDARHAIAEYGLDVSPVVLHRRSAVSKAMIAGQGVCEFEPEGAAAAEFHSLFAWLDATLGLMQ